MSNRLNPKELIEYPDVDLNDDKELLQIAYKKFGVVITEEDLAEDIPKNYVEETMKTPIVDFEEMMTRLQTRISQHHADRILAGLESLKSINERLKVEHAHENIIILDPDLNENITEADYSAPYLINVEEEMRKFKERMVNVPTSELGNMGIQNQGNLSAITYPGRGWKTENQFEIEIEDDEVESRTKKQRKFLVAPTDLASRNSAKSSTSNVSSSIVSMPKGSPKFQQVESGDMEIVISSVKSLATPSLISSGNNNTPSKSPSSSIIKLYPLPSSPVSSTSTPQMAEEPGKNTNFNQLRKVEKTRLVVTGRDSQGQAVYQVKTTAESPTVNKISSTMAGTPRINPEVIHMQSGSTSGFMFKQSERKGQQIQRKTPNVRHYGQLTPDKSRRLLQAIDDEHKRKRLLEEKARQADIAEQARNPIHKVVRGVDCLICRSCKIAFPKEREGMYVKHMQIKHSVDLRKRKVENVKKSIVKIGTWYKCQKCGEKFRKDLEAHRASCSPQSRIDEIFKIIRVLFHAPETLNCGICPKVCQSRANYLQHLTSDHQVHKVIVDPKFRCGNCLLRCEDSVTLSKHAISCTNMKPSAHTVMEIAQSLLSCELCLKSHNTIGEAQSCYQSSGIIRCMFCMHTEINKTTFFSHMKVYHGRLTGGLKCPFCNDNIIRKVSATFEHIVAQHYGPVLNALAQGLNPVANSPPTPTKVVVKKKSEATKETTRTEEQKTNEKSIGPGIVINSSRITTNGSLLSNTLGGGSTLIQIINPQIKSGSISQRPLVEASGGTSIVTSVPTTSGSLLTPIPQLRLITKNPITPGELQRVQILSPSSSTLPPGFRLVSPAALARIEKKGYNYRTILPASARPVLQNGQLPQGRRLIPIPTFTTTSPSKHISLPISSPVSGGNSTVVTAVTQPIQITQVTGPGGTNRHFSPNYSVGPVRNTYRSAVNIRPNLGMRNPRVPYVPRFLRGTTTTQSFRGSVVSPQIVPNIQNSVNSSAGRQSTNGSGGTESRFVSAPLEGNVTEVKSLGVIQIAQTHSVGDFPDEHYLLVKQGMFREFGTLESLRGITYGEKLNDARAFWRTP